MHKMGWYKEIRNGLVILVIVSLLGYFFDLLWPTVVLTLLGFLIHWSLQLRAINNWLTEPEGEPPESRGIWGDIFDGIYHLQRHDREEKQRLRSTVSYLRESFGALRDGVVMIDRHNNIEWTNQAAQMLLGLKAAEDTGQPLVNLLRSPEFISFFENGDYSQTLDIVSPNRPEIYLRIEITNFGRGSKLLFAKDTTKIVQIEKMRRDFVANVSHELRTPLTVISGYLQNMLAMEGGGEKKMTKPLQQMLQQSARMQVLIEDLLWLSRLESMEDASHLSQFVGIDGLFSEVIAELGTLYPDQEVTVSCETDQPLKADYQQLHSAVSNLLVNACKYSESDEAILLRYSERSGSLCIEVTDRGQGIDSVHIPRLTERFYRVDHSRNRETGGTGLGLAIVKHILIANKATLEIESEYGKGSTFRCVFPSLEQTV